MKHEGQHKLNFACLACVNKHIEHKNKLLGFVRELAREFPDRDETRERIQEEAMDLLKEIEADND